jgi:hypothetical protein|tara:strand:- start:204 stop:389 length:186 start_codon:yes stop_codon:yes gene_type:complete
MTELEIQLLGEVNSVEELTTIDDKVSYVYNEYNGSGLGGPFNGDQFDSSKSNEVREWFESN